MEYKEFKIDTHLNLQKKKKKYSRIFSVSRLAPKHAIRFTHGGIEFDVHIFQIKKNNVYSVVYCIPTNLD